MGSRIALHKDEVNDNNYASNNPNAEDENITTAPGWTCTSATYENGTILC